MRFPGLACAGHHAPSSHAHTLLGCAPSRLEGNHTEPMPSFACRFRVPFKSFVVVSDPKLIPAVLGRPGLPKTQMYEVARTVRII